MIISCFWFLVLAQQGCAFPRWLVWISTMQICSKIDLLNVQRSPSFHIFVRSWLCPLLFPALAFCGRSETYLLLAEQPSFWKQNWKQAASQNHCFAVLIGAFLKVIVIRLYVVIAQISTDGVDGLSLRPVSLWRLPEPDQHDSREPRGPFQQPTHLPNRSAKAACKKFWQRLSRGPKLAHWPCVKCDFEVGWN